MRVEEAVIIEICRCAPTFSLRSIEEIDWWNLLLQANLHSVVGLVADRLVPDLNVPFGVRLLLHDYQEGRKALSGNRLKEFYRIIEALERQGIKVVVLKGCWLSTDLYQNSTLREFSDLDILVSDYQINAAKNVLLQEGYIQGDYDDAKKTWIEADSSEKSKYSNTLQHEYEFKKRDTCTEIEYCIDLHSKLSTKMEKANFQIDEMIEHRTPYSCKYGSAYRLSNEDALIHLCFHTYWHSQTLQSALLHLDICLKMYTDIRLLIKTLPIRWDLFHKKIHEMNIETAVLCTLYLCQRIFNELLANELSYLDQSHEYEVEERLIRDRWLTGSDIVLGQHKKSFLERIFDTDRFSQALESIDIKPYVSHDNLDYLAKLHIDSSLQTD